MIACAFQDADVVAMKVGAAADVEAAAAAVPDSTLPTTMRSRRSAKSEPAEHLQAALCLRSGHLRPIRVL